MMLKRKPVELPSSPRSSRRPLPSPKKARACYIDLDQFAVHRRSPLMFAESDSVVVCTSDSMVPHEMAISQLRQGTAETGEHYLLFFLGAFDDGTVPAEILEMPAVRALGVVVNPARFIADAEPSQELVTEVFDDNGHFARACRVLDPLGGGRTAVPSIVSVEAGVVRFVIPVQSIDVASLKDIVRQLVER